MDISQVLPGRCVRARVCGAMWPAAAVPALLTRALRRSHPLQVSWVGTDQGSPDKHGGGEPVSNLRAARGPPQRARGPGR